MIQIQKGTLESVDLVSERNSGFSGSKLWTKLWNQLMQIRNETLDSVDASPKRNFGINWCKFETKLWNQLICTLNGTLESYVLNSERNFGINWRHESWCCLVIDRSGLCGRGQRIDSSFKLVGWQDGQAEVEKPRTPSNSWNKRQQDIFVWPTYF